MSFSYEACCLSDPVFYDTPVRAAEPDWQFAAANRPAPTGWERAEFGGWVSYGPRSASLPAQGWKVHVSATLENAGQTLDIVSDYCIQHSLVFKFLHNKHILLSQNAKSADRGSSGKFVTIYPRDEAELEIVLNELGARLDGREGPYILSDLRWGRGPLYVRYGGFAPRSVVAANGDVEPAIEDPDGNLVPDRRQPTFAPPSWVALPAFLESHLDARNSTTLAELPYRIETALHFSNGGGIYGAVDERSGEKVVLKEARPHAGVTGDGDDAVACLQRERQILTRLAGLDVVPSLRDYLVAGGHHYLVQDYVEGSTLNALFVQKYPLVSRDNEVAELADYAAWVTDVIARVERSVAAVHDRGVVIGDVNASNILVRPDGSIVLIDWEVAYGVEAEQRPSLGAPDFAPPPDVRGFDIDRYALALLRLHLFLPLTTLVALDPRKARDFGASIVELFPSEPAFISEAVNVVGRVGQAVAIPSDNPGKRWEFNLDSANWPDLRDSMTRAITASATPNRDERLFPGDPKQFGPGGGISIAYGAAGVLYALDAVGAGRFPDHEAWLVGRALESAGNAPLGFYDGLHGVAYVLDRLGRRDDALKVMQACMDRTDQALAEPKRVGLLDGLAGIALNLSYFGAVTGDAAFKDAAGRIVDIVASGLGTETAVPEISGGDHPYAGLLRGSAGLAVLFIRWFELTGEYGFLDLAATALRQDLRRCIRLPDNSMQVRENRRRMSYIADGSVGIGMALEDYLAHRPDEQFAEAAAAVRRTARSRFFVMPGLFSGRAGMILYLSRARASRKAGDDRGVADQVRYLAWHAINYQGNLTFPGNQLLRLSMDFATGTAGVLFALGAAFGQGPPRLPFVVGLGNEHSSAGSRMAGSHLALHPGDRSPPRPSS